MGITSTRGPSPNWPDAGVALYCHEVHRAVLAGDPGFRQLEEAGLVACYEEDRPFLTATGVRLEAIALRHDGGPTFGFRIEVSGGRRARPVSVGYLADSGSWSERMADALADVDALGVEFNHDVALQKSSGRPWVLIKRNLGDRGHLSNNQGAELVEAVLRRSRRGVLRHLVLLHLSEQCNQPDLALEVARSAVGDAGAGSRFTPPSNVRPTPISGYGRDAGRPPDGPRARSGLPSPSTGPAHSRRAAALAGLFDELDRGGDLAGAP